MKPQPTTVNSEPSLIAYVAQVRDWYAQHKYVTFPPPRFGVTRSLDQNALFHVWLTLMSAHYLRKHRDDVTEGEREGMKRTVKREALLAHPEWSAFMVHEIVNPKDPRQRKKEYTSSASWKSGEMYAVLTWMQLVAAGDGIILESRGEFAENQRAENA